jgi:hypothetical protein
MLQDDVGNMLNRHEDKATLFWEAYKDRLGRSKFTHMYFDIQSLLIAPENLDELEAPFLREEVDAIIQAMPTNKSPRHDGFNSDFLKRCWQTMSQDFFELCQGFYEGNICMQSINGSHVVLIPKIDNPTKVGDYSPISLLNCSIKLLIKILANGLQKVITKIVHRNQYGFIKHRSIQDCLAWAFVSMQEI